jgi:prepilin-type N-terminal cleavage/methylation domain-containing protein
MNRFRQPASDQQGYTIVELVVAMTIFAIVIVVAIGAFVAVQRTSNKTTAQRKVQQDSRYNLEQLARQIRAARIDYGFYQRNSADARCNVAGRRMLAMFVTDAASTGSSEPVVSRAFYFTDSDASTADTTDVTLYSLTQADVSVTPTCDDVINNVAKTKQIAEGVTLTNIQFFIIPNRDPQNTAESSAVVRNTHPRVTVLWTTRTGNTGNGVTEQSRFNEDRLEMTVSTRAYPVSQTVGQ